MNSKTTFENCEGWKRWVSSPPKGITCPPNLVYPPPPSQVEILFIGWNPPGKKHFWNSKEDNLYLDLKWVFERLEWPTQPDLWEVFRLRKYYLIHAVKCCTEAKFRWDALGLIKICTESLLKREIATINPKIICALGKVPHKALHFTWPDIIPANLNYGDGWCKNVDGRRVIITCFPNWHWNKIKKKANRECAARTLQEWMT